jgi:hypothetical protein
VRAYQSALAGRDYDEVCRLQTQQRLNQRAKQARGGGSPREVCVRFFERNADLAKDADQPFSVGSVTLTPRETQLARLTVEDERGGSAEVPMREHEGDWHIDGEAGAPGFSGTGADAPADPAAEEAATKAYGEFRRLLAEGDFVDACNMLGKRYRLVRAKSLERVGQVGTLCARSYEKESGVSEDAARPYEVTAVDLAVATVEEARADVRLGEADGIWFMRYEDGSWRFAGGGLAPGRQDDGGGRGQGRG